MTAKKDDKPVEMTNPATAAHAKDDKPEAKPKATDKAEGHYDEMTDLGRSQDDKPAKASKKAADQDEKSEADDRFDPVTGAIKSDANDPTGGEQAPKQHGRTIEDLLADPAFDREGHVRSKLAAISAQHGVGQLAPVDLVDESGCPVAQG